MGFKQLRRKMIANVGNWKRVAHKKKNSKKKATVIIDRIWTNWIIFYAIKLGCF